MSKINKIRLSGTTYEIEDSGATKTVELTQAQYDALVSGGTVDPNTFYVITDATAADLSQYWTSAQTQSAITNAVSGKQDTLVSGTNIKTINNESILGSGNIDIQGGGGSTYSAGTNISIDSANTINCTLPISADSNGNINLIHYGNNRGTRNTLFYGQQNTESAWNTSPVFIGGDYNSVNIGKSARCVFVYGFDSSAKGGYNTIFGEKNMGVNDYQTTFGYYSNSVSGTTTFGDSGNTLFSVGNGDYKNNSRHNAIEIRQNGDIYIPNTDDTTTQNYYEKPMVRLQDTIAATSANTTALGGMKIVKLTESEYTALVTKDESTLYVVLPDS